MTTAGAEGKPLGWIGLTCRWMSHYIGWFALWAGVWNTAALLLFGPDDWWLPVVGLGPLMMAMAGEHIHLQHWDCGVCVKRSPLLEGEGKAAEHLRELRYTHALRLRACVSLGALALLVGVPLLTESRLVAIAAAIPWYLDLAYTGWAATMHRDLAQWCPWCRGRDDDDDQVDAPPPVPVATADR